MELVCDCRLCFPRQASKQGRVPIVIGDMGGGYLDCRTGPQAARPEDTGHISNAKLHTVSANCFDTQFVKHRLKQYQLKIASSV